MSLGIVRGASRMRVRRRIRRAGVVIVLAGLLTPLIVLKYTIAAPVRTTTLPKSTPSHVSAHMNQAFGAMNGIACTSASRCMAVGTYNVSSTSTNISVSSGFSEAETGAAWSASRIQPGPGGSMTALNAVSCPSLSFCIAVGQAGFGVFSPLSQNPYSRQASILAESWNGQSWNLMDLPHVRDGFLTAIACPTTSECVAVGTVVPAEASSLNGSPIAEQWIGGEWRQMSLPRTGPSRLESISCPSPTECFAVGETVVSRGGPPQSGNVLILGWNENRWAIVPPAPVPNKGFRHPNVAMSYELNGISCASVGSCVAVGDFQEAAAPAVFVPLVEQWDGAFWRVASYPDGVEANSVGPKGHWSGQNPSLQAVACPNLSNSPSGCVAVGAANDYCAQVPLAACTLEAGDFRGRWRVMRPAFAGAQLNSVSCVEDSRCTAVGNSFNNASFLLAMYWNGVSWSRMSLPVPGKTPKPGPA